MSHTTRKKLQLILLTVVLFVLACTMIVPFLWTLSSSFKATNAIFIYPIEWIPSNPVLSNYITVFEEMDFLLYFSNTAYLSIVVTVGQIISCSLAAYAFAKLEFTGRDKLFLCYLGTMMVPYNAILIPQFMIIKQLNLYDTLAAMIVLHIFAAFGVFMFRQFMMSLPNELLEAARIDGCNELRIYSRIVMPMCKPAIATVGIFTFNSMWNNYMAAKIYLVSPSNRTIQIALAAFRTDYNVEYGPLTAGIVMSLIPMLVIFIVGQKYLLQGMKFSGVKG